jgi:hypothetical protein
MDCSQCEYHDECALNVVAEYDAWERQSENCKGTKEEIEKWDKKHIDGTINDR